MINEQKRLLGEGLDINKDGDIVKGKMLHLEVNKSIVKLDDREVLGVVGSGRDITEYREKLLKSGKDMDVFKENEFKNKDV